ncbi:DUF2513 domain-containing protein [Clostridium estertheticum]|uniref:DUF2513 domain-containing protein n=1 Tax=Clostridium estertheticum TaxID=238834 RepID=UPI001C6E6125|nr:DUF2513 domain-containing protein [Clostridium estertheticum]MBW9169767.1 DUF2513 domain-containing protein [Clostridium estertheticum]WLC74727.1 DUF2513 domain-containing protein [Clostridium estertheticum]
MNLNPDCIRDILLTVEANDFGIHTTLEKLCDNLPDYENNEIHYTCLKLSEGGYLELTTVLMSNSLMLDIKSIDDLSFNGHEFLATIRSETNWSKTKSVANEVGSFSLDILSKIAISVVSSMINKHI